VGVPDPAVQVRVGLVSVEHVVLAHPHHQVARRDVLNHRLLNMELDLQKFIWASCAQLYSLAETPQLPPSPAFGLIYEGAIGQPR
jgi:hypothetical protein